jgi:hypothetical protein
LRARAFEHRLDPSIGEIAHPPVNLMFSGGPLRFPSKRHPLHPARYEGMGPCIFCHGNLLFLNGTKALIDFFRFKRLWARIQSGA